MRASDQMFESLPDAAEMIGACVVNPRLAMIQREHVGINQIVRMDKLEKAIATANDIDIASLANPFKQDLENSQTTFAQDRPRPDDNQPQSRFLTNLAHRLFAVSIGSQTS